MGRGGAPMLKPPKYFKKKHIGNKNFRIETFGAKKAYGQLVLFGSDITAFTPTAYQRHSL